MYTIDCGWYNIQNKGNYYEKLKYKNGFLGKFKIKIIKKFN